MIRKENVLNIYKILITEWLCATFLNVKTRVHHTELSSKKIKQMYFFMFIKTLNCHRIFWMPKGLIGSRLPWSLIFIICQSSNRRKYNIVSIYICFFLASITGHCQRQDASYTDHGSDWHSQSDVLCRTNNHSCLVFFFPAENITQNHICLIIKIQKQQQKDYRVNDREVNIN